MLYVYTECRYMLYRLNDFHVMHLGNRKRQQYLYMNPTLSLLAPDYYFLFIVAVLNDAPSFLYTILTLLMDSKLVSSTSLSCKRIERFRLGR